MTSALSRLSAGGAGVFTDLVRRLQGEVSIEHTPCRVRQRHSDEEQNRDCRRRTVIQQLLDAPAHASGQAIPCRAGSEAISRMSL